MVCENCHKDTLSLVVNNKQLFCWSCHNATKGQHGQAPSVIPDSIPGGLEIRHGICWPDSTPRKFYAKSEIKKAAYETGYCIDGDTPKPNPRLQDEREAARAKGH